MLRISPLLDVALSVCASLFCLLSMPLPCVCALLSFCISAFFPFFFSCLSRPFFFFFFACLPLFIERFQRSCSLIFLSTDQIMEQFLSVFSSTAPNFMLSRDPFFSFFFLFICSVAF